MDILGSGEVENLSDIKHATVRTCFNDVNESNDTNTSNVEELLEQRQKSKPHPKCLAKSATFPSAVSTPDDDDDDEIVTAMQRMFSEDSLQPLSTYPRSISLPVSVFCCSLVSIGLLFFPLIFTVIYPLTDSLEASISP